MKEYNQHQQRIKLFQSLFTLISDIENDIEYSAENILASNYGVEKYEECPLFSQIIFQICCQNYNEIKQIITTHLINWTYERIEITSKSILFLALSEGLYFKKTPRKVVINEAVILSKEYSSENNYKFINATLDRILEKDE